MAIDLDSYRDQLRAEVPTSVVPDGKILSALACIVERHPQLDQPRLIAIREAVKAALLDNVEFAHTGAFHLLVLETLENNGTLAKEPCIADDAPVDPRVLERMHALGNKRHANKTAYIILNSKSPNEVRRKCAAASFSCDDMQLLMPLFHTLCERDPSIRVRLGTALSALPIASTLEETPNLLKEYCFDMGGHATVVLSADHPYIPAPELSELHETYINFMLNELKAYLLAV